MTTLIAIVAEHPRDRAHEAIGADDRARRQFLSELLIALAGIAAGLALGFVLAQFWATPSSAPRFVPRGRAARDDGPLASLLDAVALPLKMAVRIVPAQVLKEVSRRNPLPVQEIQYARSDA